MLQKCRTMGNKKVAMGNKQVAMGNKQVAKGNKQVVFVLTHHKSASRPTIGKAYPFIKTGMFYIM